MLEVKKKMMWPPYIPCIKCHVNKNLAISIIILRKDSISEIIKLRGLKLQNQNSLFKNQRTKIAIKPIEYSAYYKDRIKYT